MGRWVGGWVGVGGRCCHSPSRPPRLAARPLAARSLSTLPTHPPTPPPNAGVHGLDRAPPVCAAQRRGSGGLRPPRLAQVRVPARLRVPACLHLPACACRLPACLLACLLACAPPAPTAAAAAAGPRSPSWPSHTHTHTPHPPPPPPAAPPMASSSKAKAGFTPISAVALVYAHAMTLGWHLLLWHSGATVDGKGRGF